MNVKWQKRYSLGNDRIDLQHRKLLHIAGSAQSATDKVSYQAFVVQLYRQFRIHFDDEEALM
jgi:hemerythrin